MMADRNKSPREGDISARALCHELLILHLLLCLSMSPDLTLRVRPVRGKTRKSGVIEYKVMIDGELGHMARQSPDASIIRTKELVMDCIASNIGVAAGGEGRIQHR